MPSDIEIAERLLKKLGGGIKAHSHLSNAYSCHGQGPVIEWYRANSPRFRLFEEMMVESALSEFSTSPQL